MFQHRIFIHSKRFLLLFFDTGCLFLTSGVWLGQHLIQWILKVELFIVLVAFLGLTAVRVIDSFARVSEVTTKWLNREKRSAWILTGDLFSFIAARTAIMEAFVLLRKFYFEPVAETTAQRCRISIFQGLLEWLHEWIDEHHPVHYDDDADE